MDYDAIRLRADLSSCIDEGIARGRAHGITEPASPAAEEQIAEDMQIQLIGGVQTLDFGDGMAGSKLRLGKAKPWTKPPRL